MLPPGDRICQLIYPNSFISDPFNLLLKKNWEGGIFLLNLFRFSPGIFQAQNCHRGLKKLFNDGESTGIYAIDICGGTRSSSATLDFSLNKLINGANHLSGC